MKYYFLLFSLFLFSIFAEPPRTIPPELYQDFTLNHQIPVLNWYIDGTQFRKGSTIILKNSSEATFYSKKSIDANIKAVKSHANGYYGITDQWLYQALNTYPIHNKEVLIIGSVKPWYESIVIAYGGHPTTVEYNKIVTDDPRLTIMTVEEFNQNPKKFDLILSISYIEHDGLGRYGDPINPYADFEFMLKAKGYLKEGGAMILAVPVGRDCLVWNAHRIYGKLRLPLLIDGWNLVKSFGFDEKTFSDTLGNANYQPVFYLTPNQ